MNLTTFQLDCQDKPGNQVARKTIGKRTPWVSGAVHPKSRKHSGYPEDEMPETFRDKAKVRFLAENGVGEVVGFALIYVAIFVYAVVYFQTHRWLSYMIIGSIVLFISNIPCLWFAPKAAVFLMVLSILATCSDLSNLYKHLNLQKTQAH